MLGRAITSTITGLDLPGKCRTVEPAIRDPRFRLVLSLRRRNHSSPSRKTRHGSNLVNFHSSIVRDRGSRTEPRLPATANSSVTTIYIYVAIYHVDKARSTKRSAIGSAVDAFVLRTILSQSRQHTERTSKTNNGNTFDPAASAMDPKWTSFGASSLDQLGLFCFLNTHRCSGSTLIFFFFIFTYVFHQS